MTAIRGRDSEFRGQTTQRTIFTLNEDDPENAPGAIVFVHGVPEHFEIHGTNPGFKSPAVFEADTATLQHLQKFIDWVRDRKGM